MVNTKYNIIYADPPWQYRDKASAGKRGVHYKYDLMTLEDIKALPISQISAEDSILFLWVTFPLIKEGLEVIESWGFKYKTIGFNWVKKNKKSDSFFFGMGNFTRCLKGDTKVYLLIKDKITISTIEQIGNYNLNDIKIWTPFGWRKVFNWIKNETTSLSKITTLIGDIYCSEDHKFPFKEPISTRVSSKTHERKIVHVIKDGNIGDINKALNKSLVSKNRHSVNLLYSQKPLESANPVTELNGFDLTTELAWIIGLFCAGGNYGAKNGNQIRFSLHSKETVFYERIYEYIKSLKLKGDRYKKDLIVNKFTKNNNMTLYFSKSSIKNLFQEFILGTGSHGKRLNIDLLIQTSVEFRTAFLQGMLDGDGHKVHGKYWKLVLCNKELIQDFKMLADTLGLISNMSEAKPQLKGSTLCYKYILYFLSKNKTADFYNQQVNLLTIKNISRNEKIEASYDIEVEDHYFIANDIITHNSNSEVCLIGVRGKPKRVNASVSSLIVEPVRKHSQKPDSVRNNIVKLMGDLPRIELFSRQQVDGWDCIGNEINGKCIKEALNELIQTHS